MVEFDTMYMNITIILYMMQMCLLPFFSDNLQGNEGTIHPKMILFNQSRDHSTGGSYNSSDRGSNSTSGKAIGYAAQWWILKRQAMLLKLPSCFLLIS